MSCPRAIEVEAARDGRLADRSTLDRHLETCVDCRAHALRLAALAHGLRTAPVASEDDLAAQRARNRLIEAYGAPRGSRRGRMLVAGAVVAATAAVLLIVAHTAPPTPTPDPIVIDAEHARWSRVDDGAMTTVRLEDGDAQFHVEHAGPARRLVVLVPDGELEDVGTTFFVRVRDGHTLEVRVDEGRVAFRHGSDPSVLLTAGQRWTAHDPVAVGSPPPIKAPEMPVDVPRPTASSPARTPTSVSRHPAEPPIACELRDAVAALDGGDPGRAAAKLREIIARYPDDARAEDAAYLLVIALQRASDGEGARAAARDYLRRFPDGFRRAAIEPIAR